MKVLASCFWFICGFCVIWNDPAFSEFIDVSKCFQPSLPTQIAKIEMPACEVGGPDKLPLYIYGEFHNDAGDAGVRSVVTSLAEAGLMYSFFENSTYQEDLDAPSLSYGLSTDVDNYARLLFYLNKLTNMKDVRFWNFRMRNQLVVYSLALLKPFWKTMPNFDSLETRKLAQAIEDWASQPNLSPQDAYDFVDAHSQGFKKNTSLVEIIKGLTPKIETQFLSKPNYRGLSPDELRAFALTSLRELNWDRILANYLCEAKARKKILWVQVGLLHVSHLKCSLQALDGSFGVVTPDVSDVKAMFRSVFESGARPDDFLNALDSPASWRRTNLQRLHGLV